MHSCLWDSRPLLTAELNYSGTDDTTYSGTSATTIMKEWVKNANSSNMTIYSPSTYNRDDEQDTPEDIGDLFVSPYILAFQHQNQYNSSNLITHTYDILDNPKKSTIKKNKVCLRASRGILDYFCDSFVKRKTAPDIGRKLVLTLVWSNLSPLENSDTINAHVNLLITDYRKDWPPFDIYMYEPMEISDRTPERKVPNSLVKEMVKIAKAERKTRAISKDCAGIFLYGKQPITQNDCFSNIINIVDSMVIKGPTNGLKWLLATSVTKPVTRWQ